MVYGVRLTLGEAKWGGVNRGGLYGVVLHKFGITLAV